MLGTLTPYKDLISSIHTIHTMTAPTTTTTTTLPSKPTMTSLESTDGPLFPASLISPEVIASLPTDYTIRPLRRSDFKRGYLDVLRVLTTVGEISEEQWDQRFDWIASRNDEYYMLVVCDGEDRVVGTGSLIVERKFIHSLGLVGHIEDIAVEKGQQGKKLGLRIIQALDYVAAQVGCYKVCFLALLMLFLPPLFLTLLLIPFRVSLIAPRSMRVSTLSAVSSALVSKWLTTTEYCQSSAFNGSPSDLLPSSGILTRNARMAFRAFLF